MPVLPDHLHTGSPYTDETALTPEKTAMLRAVSHAIKEYFFKRFLNEMNTADAMASLFSKEAPAPAEALGITGREVRPDAYSDEKTPSRDDDIPCFPGDDLEDGETPGDETLYTPEDDIPGDEEAQEEDDLSFYPEDDISGEDEEAQEDDLSFYPEDDISGEDEEAQAEDELSFYPEDDISGEYEEAQADVDAMFGDEDFSEAEEDEEAGEIPQEDAFDDIIPSGDEDSDVPPAQDAGEDNSDEEAEPACAESEKPESPAAEKKEKSNKQPPEKIPRDGKLRDVFLLYTPSDLVLAYKLTCLLEKNGVSCVLCDRDLPRNDENHAENRLKAMRACRMALVVISEKSAKHPLFIRYLTDAREQGLPLAVFKRDVIADYSRFQPFLSAAPVIERRSFSTERTVMVVRAFLNNVRYKKNVHRSVKKKRENDRVIDLNKIYHSPRHIIGCRLLWLIALAYLLFTTVAYLPEFGQGEWLSTQFPSSQHLHGIITEMHTRCQSLVPFDLSPTALTAAAASLAAAILSVPFTRYLVKKASLLMIIANMIVLALTAYSVFTGSKDLISLCLKLLPLILSMIPLIILRIISGRLTKIRR